MVELVLNGFAFDLFTPRSTSDGPPTAHTIETTLSTASHLDLESQLRPTDTTLGGSTRTVTWTRALVPDQEEALCNDYLGGWTVKELTIIYRVSERTVYRLLAEYDIPRTKKRKSRKKRTKSYSTRELQPCGTNAAYQRHRKKGEYPCTPCLEAHAANVAEATRKRKERNARSRAD